MIPDAEFTERHNDVEMREIRMIFHRNTNVKYEANVFRGNF